MSCSQPPRRHSSTRRRGQAELRRDAGRQVGDLLGVRLGMRLAQTLAASDSGLGEPDDLGLLGDQVVARHVGEQADAVAAAALGGVQRLVGRVDERVGAARSAASCAPRRPRR